MSPVSSARGAQATSEQAQSARSTASSKSSNSSQGDTHYMRRSKLKKEDQFQKLRMGKKGGNLNSPGSPRGGGSPRSGRSPRAGRSPAASARGGRSARSGGSSSRSPRRSPRRGRGGRTPTSGRTEGSQSPKKSARRKRSARKPKEEHDLSFKGRLKRLCREFGIKKCRERFEDWRAQRQDFLEEIEEILDALEEDEDYDWDNLDDFGNPAKVVHIMPHVVRRRYKWFLFVYWYPFMDLLDRIPTIGKLLRRCVWVIPTLAFLSCSAWLGWSLYINWQYDKGDCIVHELPDDFDTDTRESMVRATYTIKRFYPPTPQRIEGFVIQTCLVEVACDEINHGASQLQYDDRCVRFRSWRWRDPIDCFFHEDDLYGDKGKELYCLHRPSKLQREMFSCAVTGGILFVALLITGIYTWRAKEEQKQNDKEDEVRDKDEQEEAEAKRIIQEREIEEARRQEELMNKGEGDETTESNVSGGGGELDPGDNAADEKSEGGDEQA